VVSITTLLLLFISNINKTNNSCINLLFNSNICLANRNMQITTSIILRFQLYHKMCFSKIATQLLIVIPVSITTIIITVSLQMEITSIIPHLMRATTILMKMTVCIHTQTIFAHHLTEVVAFVETQQIILIITVTNLHQLITETEDIQLIIKINKFNITISRIKYPNTSKIRLITSKIVKVQITMMISSYTLV
jgi:hypothetical protein